MLGSRAFQEGMLWICTEGRKLGKMSIYEEFSGHQHGWEKICQGTHHSNTRPGLHRVALRMVQASGRTDYLLRDSDPAHPPGKSLY